MFVMVLDRHPEDLHTVHRMLQEISLQACNKSSEISLHCGVTLSFVLFHGQLSGTPPLLPGCWVTSLRT